MFSARSATLSGFAWVRACLRGRHAQGWLGLLVALLLWTQGFGLVHRVQHAASAAPVAVLWAAMASAPAAADSALHAAFGHGLGSAECGLWDHTALGDTLIDQAGGTDSPQPQTADLRGTTIPSPPLGSAAAYGARAPPLQA